MSPCSSHVFIGARYQSSTSFNAAALITEEGEEKRCSRRACSQMTPTQITWAKNHAGLVTKE